MDDLWLEISCVKVELKVIYVDRKISIKSQPY